MNSNLQTLESKELRLREIIGAAAERIGPGRAIVGFSGGVDSSLLLWETVQALGADKVTAVTAVSPTSFPGEEQAAREFAGSIPVKHVVFHTPEMGDCRFTANTKDRCYICKTIRYSSIRELAEEQGGAVIFDGSQADDDPDERPGTRALKELGISSPLVEAHIGKDDVRRLLRLAGHADLAGKSAQPCLATRIPFDAPITLKALEMIREGEQLLRASGLSMVRLRHHFPIARIVTDRTGISLVLNRPDLQQRICRGLKRFGYVHITIDLEEYGSNIRSS